MTLVVELASTRTDLSGYPNLANFVVRMHARPAYQRAIKTGQPAAAS